MQSKPKFTITTLGCKVNQCESDAIGKLLEANDIPHQNGEGASQVCIVNTCTVTQKASMQSRQAIRKAIKKFPNAKIIVTGCYAQVAPEELAAIQGVTAVIGNSDKMALAELLTQLRPDSDGAPEIIRHNIHDQKAFAAAEIAAHGARTRPFLKIQDGCDAFCTYCIVPHTRGRSRSMALSTVLDQLNQLHAAGFQEVVLTGIHLGCYGRDLTPPVTLLDLLETINHTAHMKRIRLSSIEPMELSAEIIALVAASQRFCRHFHIPLQSGDNAVLERMGRPYTREVFSRKVIEIQNQIPDAAIGADVLVGFPGETDAAFENTLALIESLPISYLHIFPFSPRKKTPAFTFNDKVPEQVTKARCALLKEVGQNKKRRFFQDQIGKSAVVLVEGNRDRATGMAKGVSSNYLPVLLENAGRLKNSLVRVRLTQVTQDLKVIGEIQAEDH